MENTQTGGCIDGRLSEGGGVYSIFNKTLCRFDYSSLKIHLTKRWRLSYIRNIKGEGARATIKLTFLLSFKGEIKKDRETKAAIFPFQPRNRNISNCQCVKKVIEWFHRGKLHYKPS